MQLLIPVASVEKISKEKTVKIIPNAIGVATSDERHVFGSFISRESAYRLMISIWRPETDDSAKPATLKGIESSSSLASNDLTVLAVAIATTENNSNDNNNQTKNTLDVPKLASRSRSRSKSPASSNNSGNLRCRRVAEVSESIEEDSSSAVSSNESPCGLMKNTSCTEPTSTTKNDFDDNEPKSNAEKRGHCAAYKFLNYEIPSSVHIGYLAFALVFILILTAGFMVYQIYVIENAPRVSFFDGNINWVNTHSIAFGLGVLRIRNLIFFFFLFL